MQQVQVEPVRYPASREEVTESWLAELLAAHPEFQARPPDSIALTPMGEGIGQLSVLLLADVADADGDRQLVVKLHAGVPEMHDIGLRYGHYQSEVNFYRHLASEVPIRTPKVYANGMDEGSGHLAIVMESFAGWHSPDQVSGASLTEIEIAVDTLAGLTAAYWEAPLQSRHPWVRDVTSAAYVTLPGDYQASGVIATDRYEKFLPASGARAIAEIGGAFAEVMRLVQESTRALAHWDYRVENLFYGADQELVVIDWQLMMLSNPANDLAYLLGTNIDVDLRRAAEADLIDRFLEGLKQHGVAGYGRNHLERDYRIALLFISAIPIIGGAGADISNPRNLELFGRLGQRAFQAVEDWDALALLR